MRIYLIYILKTIYYFFAVFLIYRYSIIKSRKQNSNKSNKLDYRVIIIFALIMGVYGIICGPVPYVLDRENYAIRFQNDFFLPSVKENSLGLYYIEVFLHLFSHNPNLLFFFIAFLYYLITLVAYSLNKDSTPLGLLFALLCPYGLFGFYLFKQCIAIALIPISLYFFRNKKYNYSLAIALIATIFHESAWIVFPIYGILYFSPKSKIKTILCFLGLFLITIFFNNISHAIVNIFNRIPGMSLQVSNYLTEEGKIVTNYNVFTIMKGLPEYIVLFFALTNSKTLEKEIEDYNLLLILTIFVCATRLLSFYMYWMWRFGTYFTLPVWMFAAKIYKSLSKSFDKKVYILVLILLLFGLQLKLLLQYYFVYGGIC